MSKKTTWHKVLDNPAELPEGRVMTVTAAHKTFCLSHYEGKFGCLDNKCLHQSGPLGEDKTLLRMGSCVVRGMVGIIIQLMEKPQDMTMV